MYSFSLRAISRRTLLLMAVTSTLLLTGCGFHLKHQDGLADKFPEIYIQTKQPTSELTRLVKLRLRGAGIEIVNKPSEDIAVLTLNPEQRSERTISLYATALSAEQEIGFTMNYSVKLPLNETKDFSVNIYRDFLNNSSEALAKSRETELITKELRSIAADHVINSMLSMKNEPVELP